MEVVKCAHDGRQLGCDVHCDWFVLRRGLHQTNAASPLVAPSSVHSNAEDA